MKRVGEMKPHPWVRQVETRGEFKEVWTKDGTRYIAFIPDEEIPESWQNIRFDAEIKSK